MKTLDLLRYDDIRRRRHTMKQRVAEARCWAERSDCQANDFFEAFTQEMRAAVAQAEASGSPVTFELLPPSPTTTTKH